MKDNLQKKQILDIINSKSFLDLKDNLENLLSETAIPTVNEDELYSLISDNYFKLIKKLQIGKFSNLSFADYNDPRVVVIDGKEFDFDSVFSHNDSTATECLCEIDALMADINKDESVVLKEIEKRLNG